MVPCRASFLGLLLVILPYGANSIAGGPESAASFVVPLASLKAVDLILAERVLISSDD